MKVAVWGSMNHGNFGDDVMNVMIGITLKKHGCTPYLYRLDKNLAQKYDLISVDNLDDLLNESAFSVIGGGAWLNAGNLGDAYEADIQAYSDKLIEYKVPFYAISIGGNSKEGNTDLSQARKNLFSSECYQGATVRLKEDLITLGVFPKEVIYYPDIILCSNEFFLNKEKKNKRTFDIAISVYDPQRLKKLVKLLGVFSFMHNYKIHFINTHLPEYNYKYEYFSDQNHSCVNNCQYTDIDEFYEFLNNMDVVICHKLHPGVAALACDTSYMWLKGNNKVKLFFDSIGVDGYEYTIDNIVKLVLTGKIKSEVNMYSKESIDALKKESYQHIQFLERLIEKYKK